MYLDMYAVCAGACLVPGVHAPPPLPRKNVAPPSVFQASLGAEEAERVRPVHM